ncbi:hypothetical protein PENTCL1PPCAC_3845, partial [Pristionchus entomophagus]
ANALALSASLLCPSAPFNDVSGHCKADCVEKNLRLSCRNEASITVYINGAAHTFNYLMPIDGTWFAIGCGEVSV